jgi:hypothetical protein
MKMLPHLVECAKAGRMTSYEELGKAMDTESRVFSRPLAFIRDFLCANHNLPPLTVIVQKRGPGTRSNSFDPERFSTLSQKEYAALEQEMLARVFAYDNWDRVLSGLQKMYTPI